jgi:hypothetical protein
MPAGEPHASTMCKSALTPNLLLGGEYHERFRIIATFLLTWTIRGEPRSVARLTPAPTTLYSVVHVGPKTMMQPCASAARAPGWRVHSKSRHGSHGSTADHHHLGSSSASVAERRRNRCFVYCFTHCAGCRTTPSGTSPVVTNRHSATRSLRASPTIMVLRDLPSATRVRNHTDRALSFW